MTMTDSRPAATRIVRLINPATGVRFEYQGRWLRAGKATDNDVRRGFARFRGDKVFLSLPPGVQKQLDAGHLQLDTEYEARRALEESQSVDAMMPADSASKEAWIGYAISQGMSRDEAAGLTRAAIKARFKRPEFDPDAPPEDLSDDGKYEVLG